MFRRIVSNLSFSPALVGQLGFYAKRLRKEEATRRIGLIFTALALVVQSLAVFSPPEAANAATPGQYGSSPRCDVDVAGPRGSAFNINGNDATVTLKVSGGKNCKVQISANSYYAPTMDGHPYSQQTLFDRTTRVYDTPGSYTIKTTLPPKSNENKGCFYQVDLTYGTNNVLPVLAYGHGRLDCQKEAIQMAACKTLSVIQTSNTSFSLRGEATTSGGAKVTAYTYTVKNSAGVTIYNQQIPSGALANQINYSNVTPGSYTARLTVQTSLGPQTGAGCQKNFVVATTPVANCSAVEATITDRTHAFFKGTAAVAGGATIKSYTFVVKDAKGVEIKRQTVTTNASVANTTAIELSKAGTYSVELTVSTSLGNKTAASCVKQFTIAPPQVCQYNPSLPPSSPDCQPCPDNPTVWVKDEKCKADIVSSKTATNLTQGNVSADTVTARASDKLTYTVTVENKGIVSQPVTLEEDLADVLEYSTLVDQGGASFNATDKTLTWPAVTLAAGQKQSRTFAVQVMDQIPSTNTGTGIATSYDCKMTNTFGNTVTVNMDCPPQKVVVEQVTSELPHTGPRENLIFAGVLLAIVVFFYARSRQLGTEVRLIRRNLNTGTI